MIAAVGRLGLRRVVETGIGVFAMCVAAELATAADAAAGEVPDSAQLAELRAELKPPRVARLIGTFGTLEIRHPLLDSTGVRSADWDARTRAAIVVTGDTPPAKVRPTIPWSEISEMQSGQNRVMQGALIGLAAGLLIGSGLVLDSFGTDDGKTAVQAIATGIGVAVATPFAGALIFSGRGWHTIYPRVPSQ
jgi:hypothetical protein